MTTVDIYNLKILHFPPTSIFKNINEPKIRKHGLSLNKPINERKCKVVLASAPDFVTYCTSDSEGSSESVHMHRLT